MSKAAMTKTAPAASAGLHQDPRWIAAYTEVAQLRDALADLDLRYDQLRGVAPAARPNLYERARRYMRGETALIEADDSLDRVASAREAVKAALPVAAEELARVEREISRQWWQDRGPDRLARLRRVLAALHALDALNDEDEAARDLARSLGYDPTDSGAAVTTHFEPELIEARIEAIEAELREQEDEAADYGDRVLAVRLQTSRPSPELLDAQLGDVIELPERLARRLIRNRQAEQATDAQLKAFQRTGRPVSTSAVQPAYFEYEGR